MKSFQAVVGECPHLTPAEVRVFDLVDDRDPAGSCDPGTALALYLVDVLKFDRYDYRHVTLVMRYFRRPLALVADELHSEFRRRQSQLPRVLLGFMDGRVATLSGVANGLDLNTGETVSLGDLPPPVKYVTYNLTAIMTLRWAGSVPEDAPNDSPDPPAGAAAGG